MKSRNDFDPAAALARYHAGLNALDWPAIEAAFAEAATYVSNGVGALTGRDAILAAFRAYFAEYSDQVATDERIEAMGPRSARAVWTLTATSVRSGRVSKRSGVEMIDFDAEGRILRVDVVDEPA